jgi:hypothetical protein
MDWITVVPTIGVGLIIYLLLQRASHFQRAADFYGRNHQELINELRLTQEIMVGQFRELARTVADGKVYDIYEDLEDLDRDDDDEENIARRLYYQIMRPANMRLRARQICADFRYDYGKDAGEIEDEAKKATGYKRWLRDDDLEGADDEEEVSK